MAATTPRMPPIFNYVEEGQPISLEWPGGHTTEEPVHPAHEGGQGHWYCAIHRLGFATNIAMQSHNDEPGSHVWAWICFEHGPEVP